MLIGSGRCLDIGAGTPTTPGMAIQMAPVCKRQITSPDNPARSLFIDNFELEDVILGWLLLIADRTFLGKHIGLFCDNNSAVNWATKMKTSKSIPAIRLLYFLDI
eukprot:7336143-Ditylum_brightwellii.AAC.1